MAVLTDPMLAIIRDCIGKGQPYRVMTDRLADELGFSISRQALVGSMMQHGLVVPNRYGPSPELSAEALEYVRELVVQRWSIRRICAAVHERFGVLIGFSTMRRRVEAVRRQPVAESAPVVVLTGITLATSMPPEWLHAEQIVEARHCPGRLRAAVNSITSEVLEAAR
jgi:hypothetical protein